MTHYQLNMAGILWDIRSPLELLPDERCEPFLTEGKTPQIQMRYTLGYPEITEYVRGWVNYFRLADMKDLLQKTDEWMRRRIRAVIWKQWKRVRTRYRMLRKLHVEERQIHMLANCRKGTWRAAKILSTVITKERLARAGYPSLLSQYQMVRENL